MFTKKLPYSYNDLSLMKAIDVVTRYDYGIIIILNSSKQLKGIFTDGDLRRVLKKYNDISTLNLYKVMTKRPFTVSTGVMAVEALNIMEKNEITSLIVINQDKTVAGLLTLNELLRNGIE